MNCAEVQQVLPEIIDGSGSSEYQAHLKSCSECSELVSDLELIAREARQLAEIDDPPARVWVKLAAELRAEGIIREPEATPTRPVLVPNTGRRWNVWWLVPVAAALVAAGSYVIKPKPSPALAEKQQPVASQPASSVAEVKNPSDSQPNPQKVAAKRAPVQIPFPQGTANSDSEDRQFLDDVARQAPMMRATYEKQLRSVNSYIRDASEYAQQNPGDQDARQHLMDAYEQKAMLYQMALDHVQ